MKVAKNRRFVEARLEERISALSVRLFLKEFCVEFLNASYNAVMKYAKHCIVGSNQAASLDVSYFFWTLRFFMEFNRHHKFQVKYIWYVQLTIEYSSYYFFFFLLIYKSKRKKKRDDKKSLDILATT